jgi:DNA processing protein
MHYNTAKKMMENGGLVSDFRTGTNPDKENFPKRNRIIAGLADLTIVIESSKKGGSLITAEYANAYNRDVFALPGRINDEFSEGCNRLIKTHKAFLLESVKDIEYIMGWEKETENTTNPQTQLLLDLTPEEEIIVNQLKTQELPIDDLAIRCDMPVSKTASVLLTLELKNIVKSLPGKLYKIN